MTRLEIENEIQQINEEFGLTYSEGKVTTTSLKVAEIYGKEHKDVLKKIRSFIELIPELNGLNFKLVDYVDAKGESRPMYSMDRQGFSMLGNKFRRSRLTHLLRSENGSITFFLSFVTLVHIYIVLNHMAGLCHKMCHEKQKGPA